MTREAFRELVKKGPVLLDGATGTNLQKAGMPVGVCPEQWILENSEVLIDLQKQYVEAGTDILFAPTFTASRIKLKEYGLEDHLEEMNRKLVALSKEAAKGTNALVAGDLTMTGEQLYPLGDLMFEDLVDVYKEQAKIIAEAGADLFVVETMMSLQECRAAVLAIREVCDLPVMVSLTYNEDGRTLYGTDPVTAVVVMQSLGADAVGMNCSTGPEAMLEPIAKMAEYAAIPLLAKPNAGMPELIDGQTVFNVEPEEFAEVGKKLVEEGAAIIGGCCGTTPEHIRALKEAVKGIPVKAPLQTKRRMLTSERKSVEITLDGRFMVIGERINPTGKKKLQAELKEGSLNLVRTMALEQEENGASILDINMGMNGIDEKEMMLRTIYEVTSTVDCPLCIDSSHVDIIEAALRIYPGRALINSISLEKEKFEKLLPIAKKYGAMFILLPLSDEGLPKDSAEKHGIIRTIMDEAVRIGMAKEDIIVDGLVATIGANPNAALECFETFSYCKNELELPTACGLSNISFGLPERTYVNTAFLTMAIANGLTMAIANPSQELLMNAAFASDMLLNKKESDIRYIERMNFLSEKYAGMERVMVQKTPAGTSAAGGETRKESTGSGVFQAVLKGNKEHVLEEVKKMLDGGAKPDEIINEHLIAAINEVGELFDKKKFHLHLEPYQSIILVTGKSNQKLYCKGQLLQTIKVADVALKSYQEQIFSSSKKMFIEDDLTKLYPHFSGQIQYHFELNIEQKNVLLELEEAYEIVQIIVNGKDGGTYIAPPYIFDLSQTVVEGKNQIEIITTNNLSRNQRDAFSVYIPIEPLGIRKNIKIYSKEEKENEFSK